MKRPPVTNAQIAAEYIAGASTLAIGRKYQRCHSAIIYRLRTYGITLRRAGAPTGNQNAKGKQS